MSELLQRKLFDPAARSWKGERPMSTQNLPEAKGAWLIAQMIEEFNDLLWNCYGDEFINFLLEEDRPYYQSLLSNPK
jgi:hypothetical protein